MEELISKKDLLDLTNISYGQLYRWKRKKIIPEEWFIKRSVPSGQETFFPKEKILERIDVILNMKDETSLDELAKIFSTEVESGQIDLKKLVKTNLLSEESIGLYKQVMGKTEINNIRECVGVKLFKEKVMMGHITATEGKILEDFISKHYDNLSGEKARIYLMRHMGMPLVMGAKDYTQLILDEAYKVIIEINLYDEVSTIKFQMMG